MDYQCNRGTNRGAIEGQGTNQENIINSKRVQREVFYLEMWIMIGIYKRGVSLTSPIIVAIFMEYWIF